MRLDLVVSNAHNGFGSATGLPPDSIQSWNHKEAQWPLIVDRSTGQSRT